MEDEGAAFGVPRLLLRGVTGPPAPAVTWELRYGGRAIASGSMPGDQELLFTDVDSILPVMDGAGLTFAARYEDGRPAAIEATCVRPVPPPTRAEAMARAQWPGVRDQPGTPGPRGPLLAEVREIFPAGAVPGDLPRARRVCVYAQFSVLLAARRRRLHGRAPGPARPGGPADGAADA